ncbi:hypothetical protein [Tabrizicola sp.]|uniref:hypothetical protein n=1 Tax=Tabrizicola sp. TaxID=2005166 RepID=UPI0035B2F7E5
MSLRLALLILPLATPACADLALSSQVPGLDLVALADLPAAPQDQGEPDFCAHLFVETVTTPGGKDAAAKGWHVTAELPLGDLTAVSFIGHATPATSGTCELGAGNVGFYSGSHLVALAYGTEADALLIGSLRPFGTGLRILSGDVVAGTVADLSHDGSALAVIGPATEEPVCDGSGIVPGIEGLPIDKARDLLLQSGWQPVPGDPAQQNLGWAGELAAAGVPEVEDCSGTGFAFCSFRYSGPAGELSVVTAGEGGEDGSLPGVVRYGVDCR